MSEHITRMPTVGTILNMTPAAGVVEFTAPDGETWTLPLIGWGVYVSLVDNETGEWETSVDPMILMEEDSPQPLQHYREYLDEVMDYPIVKARVVIDK